MAQRMTIPIVATPEYLPRDVLEVEIDGDVQPDRIIVADPERNAQGFGFELPTLTPFGRLALSPAVTPFGLGLFGVGAKLIEYQTRASFDAGDYSVRIRARDALGNVSAWSSAYTLEHRPEPGPPRNLTVSGMTLGWVWP